MQEIIYLRVNQQGVRTMTKTLPLCNRGEIPVKLTINVEPGAFREPIIEKEVTINDWQEDIPASDVNFEKTFITPQEADMLRQKRLTDMAAIMKKHGYTVTRNAEGADA